jgi:hypothetical protein
LVCEVVKVGEVHAELADPFIVKFSIWNVPAVPPALYPNTAKIRLLGAVTLKVVLQVAVLNVSQPPFRGDWAIP